MKRHGLRFIPARAGNRASSAGRYPWRPVHPRACGEQFTRSVMVLFLRGSSPRVRGTACWLIFMLLHSRFIPARAGNSEHEEIKDIVRAVHPRACGEQVRALTDYNPSNGSSPRVRGTVNSSVSERYRRRFIPARAGNSAAPASPSFLSTVHPRACGEQSRSTFSGKSPYGSSPRVRGTDTIPLISRSAHRFIPARAGNSDIGQEYLGRAAVHPRACGEQDVVTK